MAIDTANRRAAVLGYGSPGAGVLPVPEADIDLFDRGILTDLYIPGLSEEEEEEEETTPPKDLNNLKTSWCLGEDQVFTWKTGNTNTRPWVTSSPNARSPWRSKPKCFKHSRGDCC